MKSLADSLGNFYSGRRILVTGHTGFKGSWLTFWLRKMGAKVVGVALHPASRLGMFNAANLRVSNGLYRDRFSDITDFESLRETVTEVKPEFLFHLAAQAIVGNGYADPMTTFRTNTLGTVNVLECLRVCPGISTAVLITSDKCYENVEQIWGYREYDQLGGSDPYSASKAGSEVAISAYTRSFFMGHASTNIASVRAGNIVGGGDWSDFRLVPDCIRSLRDGRPILLRNPNATRPWQFVLDPLLGYLILAKRLFEFGKEFQGAWNFGPAVESTNTVEESARIIVDAWGSGEVMSHSRDTFYESQLLSLDCTKARRRLGWKPVLSFGDTMEITTDWFKHQFSISDGDMTDFSSRQITDFENRVNKLITS